MVKKYGIICLLVCLFSGLIVAEKIDPWKVKQSKLKKHSGFFNYFWDDHDGKIWLEIKKTNQEFILVNSLASGLGSNDVGLDRNQLGDTKILKFIRIGDRLLLIQPNYQFRAVGGSSSVKQAVKDAFAYSVIWSFKIMFKTGESRIIDFTPFLLSDRKDLTGSLIRRKQGNYQLDGSRSAVYLKKTRNFPQNTEFEALLTYSTKMPGSQVRRVSPDSRSFTLHQHISLVQLPDTMYQPRKFDIRSGYMSWQYADYAAPVSEPLVKRVILRHRLRKRDPKAKVSEAVRPIVYYVDRGIPKEIQQAVIEGASWWNKAFSKIGYKDAFQVKLLPKGADPLDIRYNMINWVHRSTRGWSYGGSVSDPRTGEIIKGNVSMGSLRIRQDYLIARGLVERFGKDNLPNPKILQMALQRIRQLSCHEVGHTLGLVHNYASNVNQRSSVMDYPHPLVKISRDGSLDLSEAYTNGVGEWDLVSIAYGYQDFPEGTFEDEALGQILNQAFSRGLYYLSDQDAHSDGSAHPFTHLWDNGQDPVAELKRVMKVRKIALNNFGEDKLPQNKPLTILEDILVPVYLFHRYQVQAASKVIGGLYYNHKLKGDVQAYPKIVPPFEQRAARLIHYHALSPKNPDLNEVIDTLLNETLKIKITGDSYRTEIQRVVNQVVVHSLMHLYQHHQASSQVKAVVFYQIDQLKIWLKGLRGIQGDNNRAHFYYLLKQIEYFQKEPLKFIIPRGPKTPQGSPI